MCYVHVFDKYPDKHQCTTALQGTSVSPTCDLWESVLFSNHPSVDTHGYPIEWFGYKFFPNKSTIFGADLLLVPIQGTNPPFLATFKLPLLATTSMATSSWFLLPNLDGFFGVILSAGLGGVLKKTSISRCFCCSSFTLIQLGSSRVSLVMGWKNHQCLWFGGPLITWWWPSRHKRQGNMSTPEQSRAGAKNHATC